MNSGNPSTSTKTTTTSIYKTRPPEEFITYVVGCCSCWHITVISVFCFLVFFYGINVYVTELLVPRHIEFECVNNKNGEYESFNNCYDLEGNLCKRFKYVNPSGITITSQFQLICENKRKAKLYNALYYCGIAFGFLFVGHMADSHGRKAMLILSLFLQPCIGVLSTVTDIYSLRSVFNFLYGCFLPGSMLVPLVLTCDISSNYLRTFNLGLLCLAMASGYTSIPYLWIIFEDVSKFTLLITIPPIIGLFFMAIIQESPTWFLCQNRTSRAENTLLTVAQFNGYQVSSPLGIRPIQIINYDSGRRVHFCSLLKVSVTALPILSLYTLWFLICFMSTIDTTRNWAEHLDVLNLIALSGAVSMLAAVLSIISCYTIQHKVTLTVLSTITCIMSIVTYIVDYYDKDEFKELHLLVLEWVNYAVSMKMYYVVINLTPRIFPTEHRCLGTGIAFAIGSIAFLLSEILFSNYDLTHLSHICLVVAFTIITWICISLLFSVHNRELPDLFEDTRNFKRNFKPPRWSVLRSTTPTLDEDEVKLVDFETEASMSLVYLRPPRFFNRYKTTRV